METINKLLKKQAPKTNRRTAMLAGDETPEVDVQRADPVYVRYISTKSGVRIGVPDEMMAGPVGQVFQASGKMVEEVS